MFEILIGKAAEAGLVIVAGFAARWFHTLTQHNKTVAAIVKNNEIESFVLRQINAVKEIAADQIKKKLPKDKLLKGEEKLAIVVASVVDRFPGVSKEQATMLTKGLLAVAGEGAAQSIDRLDDIFGMQNE